MCFTRFQPDSTGYNYWFSTLNNIILRIGPDPGDDLAEWQFQIGTSVLLNFSAATKATVPGNRVTYTWTGNTRLFVGGQNTACSIRIPLVEQFVVAPINFSQIQGTADPTQFRDNSIAYTRAIAGTPAEQAGWRTKSGFAAFANAGNRVLKYVNNQVQQASLDIYDLDNVVPTANLVAPASNQIAIWTTSGLDSVATIRQKPSATWHCYWSGAGMGWHTMDTHIHSFRWNRLSSLLEHPWQDAFHLCQYASSQCHR